VSSSVTRVSERWKQQKTELPRNPAKKDGQAGRQVLVIDKGSILASIVRSLSLFSLRLRYLISDCRHCRMCLAGLGGVEKKFLTSSKQQSSSSFNACLCQADDNSRAGQVSAGAAAATRSRRRDHGTRGRHGRRSHGVGLSVSVDGRVGQRAV